MRLATAADVDAAAAVLAAAYADDPWVAWIVSSDRRQERVSALQANLLNVVGVPHGELWLAECEGTVVGAALWFLAERPVPPAAWAALTPGEAGLMGDRHDAAVAAAAAIRHLRPTEPHHSLASLGVLASHRGLGIGSALLADVLNRADAAGVPAYLETSTKENLTFYERARFALTGHVVLPDGGPDVWGMVRTPSE